MCKRRNMVVPLASEMFVFFFFSFFFCDGFFDDPMLLFMTMMASMHCFIHVDLLAHPAFTARDASVLSSKGRCRKHKAKHGLQLESSELQIQLREMSDPQLAPN